MDKVIIYGVDVSGCEFFSDMSNGKPDTICECYKDMYGFNTNCEHNKDAKNCYYKQLKRKEIALDDAYGQIHHLEQECERLKEELRVAQLNRMTMFEKLDIVNEKDTYKQALHEIREIAEKEIVCDNCNFEGTDKCDARMCTHFYLNDFSKDILTKINEVIGAEE